MREGEAYEMTVFPGWSIGFEEVSSGGVLERYYLGVYSNRVLESLQIEKSLLYKA